MPASQCGVECQGDHTETEICKQGESESPSPQYSRHCTMLAQLELTRSDLINDQTRFWLKIRTVLGIPLPPTYLNIHPPTLTLLNWFSILFHLSYLRTFKQYDNCNFNATMKQLRQSALFRCDVTAPRLDCLTAHALGWSSPRSFTWLQWSF